jgi:hypothetical protein
MIEMEYIKYIKMAINQVDISTIPACFKKMSF